MISILRNTPEMMQTNNNAYSHQIQEYNKISIR